MRRFTNIAPVLLLVSFLILPTAATAAGLDGFLDRVDVRAGADLGSFKADLSATFGVSEGKVDGMFDVIVRASDVYMCLRVGEVAKVPVDRVVDEFMRHRGQGWGVIAKNLGIKPGSAEFHALKAGRLPGDDEVASHAKKDNNGKGRK